MNQKSVLFTIFLIFGLSTVIAEIVQWQPCTYADPNASSNCTIHEVNVDPCKEAAEGKPCKIKRGLIGNITFSYTPYFSGDVLESRVFWTTQVVDIPFLGMDSNACTATTCPAVSGQQSTYQIGLPISKKYPIRMYDLKWRLWNEQEQECCFIFHIKITK